MKLFTRVDSTTTKQTWKIFLEEMRADKKRVLLVCTMLPIAQFMRIVFAPLMISYILQALLTNPRDFNTPLWLIGALTFGSIISIFTNNRGFTVFFNHEEHVTTRLTSRAMTRLMSQSYEFFANHKVGALGGDVTGFSKSYQATMDAVWLQASGIIINYTTSLIIIAFMSPLLLLPLALLTVGIVLLSIRSLNVRSPYRNKRKLLQSQLNGLVADILGNHILTKVFAREKAEIDSTIESRQEIEGVAKKEIDIIERESIYRQLLLFTFQTIALLGGIWLYGNNGITIAALIFIVTYLGRVTDSMYNITTIIRTIEQALLDAAPITKILNEPLEVIDTPDARKLSAHKGEIVFNNVSFNYTGSSSDTIFKHLNLTIPSKQRIGLAGYSGGGKTTLTKLLLRFADIQSGTIQIDGQNVAEVTQESLRAAISYVPQEPFLFHRSLRENIAYGLENATEKQIVDAAEKAHAMEFINKLPAGLDTIVGERGVKLSGGQRQRIAIARAIIKDAPILVLDEATSALDSESERLIQKSIAELIQGKTAIVIAHRLSTIAKLDRIIVIDNGAITEDGTHTELVSRNGIYANLWKHQSDSFIEE